MRALLLLVWLLSSVAYADDKTLPASVAQGVKAENPWAKYPVPAGWRLPAWNGASHQRAALALAKVCMNETSGHNPTDCAVIWQAASSHADSLRGRLGWLRGHSRRVLGDRDCKQSRNCWWTRNLGWSLSRPKGYPSWYPWTPRRWARVLYLSLELVTGRTYWRPCHIDPWSWGGSMDFSLAAERGLVPVGCAGSSNEGFVPLRLWGKSR